MKQLITLLLTIIIFTLPANASPVVSGISDNEIEIDSGFTGTKILLFGAKEDAGNIVVTIRGPKKNFSIIKKEQLFGGIWYNGKIVDVIDTNSYYSLFSTFIGQEIPKDLLSTLEIGKDNIKIDIQSGEVTETDKEIFKSEFVGQLEKKNLYSIGAQKLDFLNETLFKVSLDFPKNITSGIYSVDIYLIDDGSLISFQSIPIYVSQVGSGAKIINFANDQSFLYGLLAIMMAVIAGWLANYIFIRIFEK